MRYKQRIGTVYQAPTPCLDCENRSIGCHGDCRSYKDYKYQKLQAYNTYKHKPLPESLLIV